MCTWMVGEIYLCGAGRGGGGGGGGGGGRGIKTFEPNSRDEPTSAVEQRSAVYWDIE